MSIVEQIDPVRLQELESIGDDFVAEILQTFKDSSIDLIHDLQTALERKDLAGIKKQVHSLQGAILNIGFTELSKQIENLSGLIKNENLTEIEKHVPLFNEELHKILEMI